MGMLVIRLESDSLDFFFIFGTIFLLVTSLHQIVHFNATSMKILLASESEVTLSAQIVTNSNVSIVDFEIITFQSKMRYVDG